MTERMPVLLFAFGLVLVSRHSLGAADCNGNGVEDREDIFDGRSEDCDGNGVPDECDIQRQDCNDNGVPDPCDILASPSFIQTASLELDEDVRDLATGDIDADGDTDLVVLTLNREAARIDDPVRLSVFSNDGRGLFTLAQMFSAPLNRDQLVVPEARQMGLLDLDSDGDLDLLDGDNLFHNGGDGTFEETPKVVGTEGFWAAGDFDADGDTDLVQEAHASLFCGGLMLLLNNGSGEFLESGIIPVDACTRDLLAEDFDADGDTDIVVTHVSCAVRGTGLTTLINRGDGTFEVVEQPDVPVSNSGSSTGVFAADFDRDGFPDFAGPAGFYLNRGDGTFRITGESLGSARFVGDLDSDGDVDAISQRFQAPPRLHYNLGETAPEAAFAPSRPILRQFTRPVFGVPTDFDGDGRLDLIFRSQPSLLVLLANDSRPPESNV